MPLAILGVALATLAFFLGFQVWRYRGIIAAENEILRANEAHLRKAEDLSPVMSALIGFDGTWLKVPLKLCETLGHPEEHFIGHSVRECTEPNDYTEEWEQCRALIAGRIPSFKLHKRFVKADGFFLWCSMTASLVLDKAGNPEGILAYFIDITARKRGEENLRRSEELNRQIIEAGPGGFILMSVDGKFQRANEEALNWLGLSIEQLRKMGVTDFQGKTVFEDGSPCNPADYPAVKCFETRQKSGPQTIGYQRVDGKTVWAVFTASPIRDLDSGEFAGVIATFVDLTERKHAEEELAQAMEFLEGVIHKAPAVAIQVFDEAGRIELWNPASERLYGFSAKEMIGRRVQETLLHAEDVPDFEEMVDRLAKQRHSVEPYEWTVRHRDGTNRHVMSSMFALPRSRESYRICCIDLDITSRKSMEEDLRRSEERYRTFICASTEAIWRFECTDPVPIDLPVNAQIDLMLEMAVLGECNDAMARMYGYERAEEITGRKLSDLLDSDPRNREYLANFIASDYRLSDAESIEVDRHGERKIFLNTLIGTVKNGHLIRCWGTQRDITDRRLAEERLRRSEALLRQVLDALPVGVWVADQTGRLILGNPAGRDIWGEVKEVGEFVWQKTKGWWHQNGREIQESEWAVARALRNGESSLKEEIDIECFDGSRKTISNSAVPIRNESGEIIGAIMVNEDTTDRTRLEAQLRHAQKMESIGQLAAGVAHDFNNILTIIRGHIDLLLRRKQCPEEMRPSLEQAADAADRAASLTRQLLLFSNRQLIHPRQLDLNAVVEDAIRLLSRTLGENIMLELACEPRLPSLYTDPGMIEQIVANLALNARDAMPQGGRLSIRTGCVHFTPQDEEANPTLRAGTFLRLEVRDTGSGMDKATLCRIFEPFFTTKGIGRGTGLGLATVYGIVQRHNGWIETESEPGRGTTFRLYFPVDGELKPPLEPDVKRDGPKIRGGSETILLVEDEAPLLELVKGVLTEFGYTILIAENGIEAIDVWNHNREKIDLLLTDMMMPNGLSGRDIALRFLAEKPGLAVIFSSGYSVELFGDKFETMDRFRFLEKPYAPGELCLLVREVLDSPVQ